MSTTEFLPFPRLATLRLILRQLEERDAPEIFQLRSSEQVNKYIDRNRAETINDALQFIQNINSKIESNEALYWAIVPKNDTKLAGTICLFNIDVAQRKAEIGYELLPEHQGKGIMHEALTSVVAHVFDTMQFSHIEAFTHDQNGSSIKLLQKCEFVQTQRIENAENGGKTFSVWARQR